MRAADVAILALGGATAYGVRQALTRPSSQASLPAGPEGVADETAIDVATPNEGQMHVVMGLGPVHSYKDHSVATFQLVGSTPAVSLEVASSPLMDQCSRHDIPPAITATSPTSRGTI